jgi:hypothetical protein
MLLLIVVALTVITVTALVACAPPAAGSDELKRELLASILAADTQERSEVFSTYEELYLAKTKTQALLQGMEGREVTQSTKAWVDILLGIVDEFNQLADLSTSAVPSDHQEALTIAERISSAINSLDQYDTAKEQGLPLLVTLALERFYRGEGAFFEDLARSEEETKVKIEYQKLSASSYVLGGVYTLSDASRMEFESRRDEWIYTRDMERAADYVTAARAHLTLARNPPAGLFGAAFIEILKAKDSFDQAQRLYEKHKDRELENLQGVESEITTVYQQLMLETLKVVALYLIVIACFAGILWLDFERWDGDLHDTRLGEELIG